MEWTRELDDRILDLHTQGKESSEIGQLIPALQSLDPLIIRARLRTLDKTLKDLRTGRHTMEEIALMTGLDVTTVKFRLAALGVGVTRAVVTGTDPKGDEPPERDTGGDEPPERDTGGDEPLYDDDDDPEEKGDPVPDSIMVTLFVNKDWPLDPEYVLALVYDALADRGIDVPLEVSWTYPQERSDG